MTLPLVPRMTDLGPVLYQGRLKWRFNGEERVNYEAQVFVSRDAHVAPLRLRHDLVRRSEGHEWGYSGAGPAQLAFDILMDFFANVDTANRYAEPFNYALACRLQHAQEFDLSASDILSLIDTINREKGWGTPTEEEVPERLIEDEEFASKWIASCDQRTAGNALISLQARLEETEKRQARIKAVMQAITRRPSSTHA